LRSGVLDHKCTGCGFIAVAWLREPRFLSLSFFALALAFCICRFACAQSLTGQAPATNPAPALPSAPQPQSSTQPSAISNAQSTNPQLVNPPSQKSAKPPQLLNPCAVKNAGASMAATGGLRAVSVLGVGETTRNAGAAPVESTVCLAHAPFFNWYARFVTGPEVVRFSPEKKLRLALDNLINPFNLATIFGEAGIEIAANSHTLYGPGFPGWGRLSGVNFTQDMTDQFFGTFLIPTFTHTDPHYHRRPDLSIPRRVLHCIDETFWQQDDNGRNTHQLLPNRRSHHRHRHLQPLCARISETRFSADAERYSIGWPPLPSTT
jgi:hypothetical protein